MTSTTPATTPSNTPGGDDVTRGKRELLRHTVATLAYRAAKAVGGAPTEFADLRVGDSTRTPVQIVAHLGDLFDWALALAEGHHRWHDSTPVPWHDEVARFFAALARFDAFLASDQALGRPAEQLFQGPVADALTHVGQLTLLRRLGGAPVRAENYAKAEIVVGRVTTNQAAPKVEF